MSASKFTAEAKQRYLELIRAGGRRKMTAREMGLHPTTVWRAMYRKDRETGLSVPTAFGAQVMEAERDADEAVVAALYKLATSDADSSASVKAKIFWLTNRQSQEWREASTLRAEVSGPGGGPITHVHELGPETKEEIFRRIERMNGNLSRAGALPGAVPLDTTAQEEAEEA